MRWPKFWSFSLSISPSNEHPGLISFRMDWLDLLAVQGTLKSLLQHHSSRASILWHSALFTVQLSHPYRTCQNSLSMEFPRQAYWSGLQFPTPEDLPDPGIEPGSPAFQGGSLSSEPTEKLCFHVLAIIKSAVMDMVLF